MVKFKKKPKSRTPPIGTRATSDEESKTVTSTTGGTGGENQGVDRIKKKTEREKETSPCKRDIRGKKSEKKREGRGDRGKKSLNPKTPSRSCRKKGGVKLENRQKKRGKGEGKQKSQLKKGTTTRGKFDVDAVRREHWAQKKGRKKGGKKSQK